MENRQTISGVSLAINKTMASYQKGIPLVERPSTAGFTIKVANTLEEREAVFALAYKVYLEKGYINSNANEWLVQEYDANPETVILIVQDKAKNIAGSVTLVFDGNSKLPTEKIYGEEIQTLQDAGSKLLELSRLVINPDYRNSKEILVLLFNYLAIYSHHVKNYNGIVVQVNPRHKTYYKALLNFEEIGGEKPCPHVKNAPAVLLYLQVKKYQQEILRVSDINSKKERSLYSFFIKPEQENLVAYYLEKQCKPMTAEEKQYFGFSQSNIDQEVVAI